MKKLMKSFKKLFESVKDRWFMSAIEKAIEACADNGGKKTLGLYEAKKAREAGHSKEACMIAGINAACSDPKKRKAAKDVYKDAVKTRRIGTFIFPSVATILVIVVVANSTLASTLPASVSQTNDIACTTTADVPENMDALRVFIPAAKAVGWTADTLAVDKQVNPDLDKSTAGTRSFLPNGFKTVDEAIKFLKSGTIEAKGVIILAKSYTGCTLAELLDPTNWVLAQPKVNFHYLQMTLWDGKIKTQGSRTGKANDIFVAFVAQSDKIVIIRGGCANPTLLIPVPDEKPPEETTRPPEETTKPQITQPGETTLEPKDPSQDVLVNPLVDLWKTDGDETTHSISDDPTASNGIQVDPEAAQAAAEAAAQAAIDAANALLQAAIDAANDSGAGEVETNQTNVAITGGGPGW